MTRLIPNLRTCAVLAVMVSALPTTSPAQRHLPLTNIYTTPGFLLVDAAVEQPGVFDGIRQVRTPRPGENVEFQIFAPEAAGQPIFAYSFEIRPDPLGRFQPLEVISVTDWSGQALPVGAWGGSYAMMRPSFDRLPRAGHLCNVVLRATGQIDVDTPLELGLTVTVVSLPARRVHRLESIQILGWL